MSWNQWNIGGYPAGYDSAKHGPYDPARYYGKPDTPFGELKLREVPAWLLRREKGPRKFTQLCSRAFWRWQHKYIQPRKSGIAPFYQGVFACMIFFYIINYKKIIHHRSYKYH